MPANVIVSHLRQMTDSDLVEAEPVDEEAVTAKHVADAVQLILDKYDFIFAVTGKPSVGKSSFCADFLGRIARELTKAGTKAQFSLSRDVARTDVQFVEMIDSSTREHPRLVQVDEAALTGFLAKSGKSDQGAALETVFSTNRILQPIVGLLYPDIWGLAAFARQRRVAKWYHVERRGEATAFDLVERLHFRYSTDLPFFKMPSPWAKLSFPDMEERRDWREYEVDKVAAVHLSNRQIIEQLKARHAKRETETSKALGAPRPRTRARTRATD